MKHLILLIIILALMLPLTALERIRVVYDDGLDPDYITVNVIDNIPYFNIQELNKTLNAYIGVNIIDRRINIDLYEERLIFMLDSPFLLHRAELYNYIYDILSYQGRFYIPVLLLQRVLPGIFPEKISYDDETATIYAESPVDNSFRTIVIDPGHGGKDGGAEGYSGRNDEKDVVLAISKKLKKLIEDNLDVEVYLTREDDRLMALHERTSFANRKQANLFVSIHCNGAKNRSAHGIEVFFLSAAKTDDARAVEYLENSVIEKYEGGEEALRHYDTLSIILQDMMQTEQLKESSYLAFRLQAHLVQATGARDRGVKQANFAVLRGAFMPSVLVELGFMTNREEEQKLIDPNYQDTLARALFDGLRSYIHNYEMFR